VRDAANADDFVAAERKWTGIELRLIDGEREAQLTDSGATAGEDASGLRVCDVGGGSTEMIRAEEGRRVFHGDLTRRSRCFKAVLRCSWYSPRVTTHAALEKVKATAIPIVEEGVGNVG
jgi:hypothetical protein